jgi:hypothetical protein
VGERGREREREGERGREREREGERGREGEREGERGRERESKRERGREREREREREMWGEGARIICIPCSSWPHSRKVVHHGDGDVGLEEGDDGGLV